MFRRLGVDNLAFVKHTTACVLTWGLFFRSLVFLFLRYLVVVVGVVVVVVVIVAAAVAVAWGVGWHHSHTASQGNLNTLAARE